MKSIISNLEQQLEHLGLEPVIGLETHVTITSTKTKLFCACQNQEGAHPNTCICPICTGQMGVLPQPNQEVIKEAVKLGKAIDAQIAKEISFDRKHYYYPDLPKGFQITQYERPIAVGGQVRCFRDDGTDFSVHLDHFHIEEDPAKLTHTPNGILIDYNRSGKPLLEIVTNPDIHSVDDALSYMESLHKLVKALGISDADMEKGQFKSDISISLRKKGETGLNPRTEIKNMNSFKFSREAIIQEITNQLKYRSEQGKPKKEQLTVKWNEDKQHIEVMRKKEQVSDYRIMPEPDIPVIDVRKIEDQVFLNTELLPFEIEKKLIQNTDLPLKEIQFFSQSIERSRLLFEINEGINDLEFIAKTLINTIKEDEYTIISSENWIKILKEYQHDPYFSFTMLKSYIQALIKDERFERKKNLLTEKTSEKEILTTLGLIVKDPEIKRTIELIKQGDGKALGSMIGILAQTIGKKMPGDIVKEILIEYFDAPRSSHPQKGKRKEKHTTIQQSDVAIDEFYIAETYRTHMLKEIDTSFLGETVKLGGWVQSLRDHGDLVFIDLREEGEVFQIKVSKDVFGDIGKIDALTSESVILCEGAIIERNEEDVNPNLRTGTIELDAKKIHLLSKAGTLPFEIKKSDSVNEAKRMQYRYLDLRNTKMRENITMRHKVISEMRNFLDKKEFIEVETPIIGKASDEGSREFIVPSRLYPGQFYVLPQSPQQLKQLLIGSGIDKYYQVARCFRDEDPKGDRQPEFTQLDIELAFTSEKEVMTLISDMLLEIVKKHYPKMSLKNTEIPILEYHDVMEKYGCDKPDIRYGLEMTTLTDILQNTDFSIFRKPIDQGGVVKCIRVENGQNMLTKNYLDDKLKTFSIQQGLGGLANFHVGGENFITEKLGNIVVENIIKKTGSQEGDTLLFAAGDAELVNKALNAVRQKIATDEKLYDDNELAFCWVINFPMFEKTDEGKWKFTHNPFSMPAIKDLKKHIEQKDISNIMAQQYDIVLNGNEVGGGSIRAHLPELLQTTYEIMGYSPEEIQKSVGHMIDAFRHGFPPHGGIALGIDRLLMILQKQKTIREVIAFPKTGDGKDLMMKSPSSISYDKMKEANIRLL